MNRKIKLVVYIVIIVTLFSCDENKTGIQGDDNNNNTIVMGDNVVVSSPEKPPPKPVDIEGEWDEQKAKDLILSQLSLEEVGPTHDFYEIRDSVFEFMGFYYLLFPDKIQQIGIVTSRDDVDDCTSCKTYLNFFEFTKRENGWFLNKKHLGAFKAGAYGQFRPDDLNFLVIGDNQYGFAFTDWIHPVGGDLAYTKIYADIGGGFKKIFVYESGSDNSNYLEDDFEKFIWKSEIETIKKGTIGFYDLKIRTFGIENGIEVDYGKYYKFNGKEYTESAFK